MRMRTPFHQVITVLGSVYGVNLDSQFSEWLDVLYVFNFDAVDLTLPGSCFGSMRQRILLNALWPYGAIALVVTVIAVQGAVSHMRLAAVPQKQSATSIFLERSLYAAIFISYILLPGASRFIFKARQCVSYDTEDSDGTSRSYLIADLSIQCNGAEDADFAMLDAYFWFFFAVWPVLVPLAYLLLLTKVRSTVRLTTHQRVPLPVARLQRGPAFLGGGRPPAPAGPDLHHPVCRHRARLRQDAAPRAGGFGFGHVPWHPCTGAPLQAAR